MQALPSETVVAIIGAGAMGAGIAQVAASAGHQVKLFDVATEAVPKALKGLSVGLDKQVAKGKMLRDQADAILAKIVPVQSLQDLADAGLVIEAVVENLEIKENIFLSLESICGIDTIFASNTSSISITALGAKLNSAERLVGMHFFNPPQVMKLVEVIEGLASDNDIMERVIATAEQWGKKPVRTKSTPGFIVNRVARPYYAESLRLLQDGVADCKTIDEALSGSGKFRMGPFALMDLIGLDVNYAVTESVFKAYYYDPRFKPSMIQRELVGGGFLGRKSGRGFYHYTKDNDPVVYLPVAAQQNHLKVVGQPNGVEELLSLCEQAGLSVEKSPADNTTAQTDWLEVNGTRFAITDGRTATECSRDNNHNDWVLVDLINNVQQCNTVTLACSDFSDHNALASVAGFFQTLNKQCIQVDDAPAMVVMRTVCMLVNEAADAIKENVCTAAAVDTAMQLGTNYPRGPVEWGQSIGLANVLQVLENLHRWYGEDRYRSSVLLQRAVLNGGSLL